MPLLPQRHSVRLPAYDYSSPGAYFITICTYTRSSTLGLVASDHVVLTPLGKIVEDEWKRTGLLRPVELGAFVVMPNHFHAIVHLDGKSKVADRRSGASIVPLPGGGKRREPQVLGSLVAGFKSAVTSRAWHELSWRGPVWHRSYHEHVIRNEAALRQISEYVMSNPSQWTDDGYFVQTA